MRLQRTLRAFVRVTSKSSLSTGCAPLLQSPILHRDVVRVPPCQHHSLREPGSNEPGHSYGATAGFQCAGECECHTRTVPHCGWRHARASGVCFCERLDLSIYPSIYPSIHPWNGLCACVHVCACVCAQLTCAYPCVHTCVSHKYIGTRTRARTPSHAHARMHARTREPTNALNAHAEQNGRLTGPTRRCGGARRCPHAPVPGGT